MKAICCSKDAPQCTRPEIDGKVFINDVPEGIVPQAGEFYRAEIVEAHHYDLVARIV